MVIGTLWAALVLLPTLGILRKDLVHDSGF
jgi:hypothetical protein